MTNTPLRNLFPTVTFGTSGIRALVTDMTQHVVAAYAFAFAQHMKQCQELPDGGTLAVAVDLRPSSPAIAQWICATLHCLRYKAVFLGAIPTPALALYCFAHRIPGLVVTGSHIPFDRNGIKFFRPDGEILKDDEQAIANAAIPAFHSFPTADLPVPSVAASRAYLTRYTDFFGSMALHGLRVGVYEHSAVGRNLTTSLLRALGATVLSLGRSDNFVPIDTEAVSESDLQQARSWCEEYHLDALVSTDGDGDRPLVFDADGNFIRGDLLGLLCARTLDIKALAVPVSCNTAIEKSSIVNRVIRTQIGSPYVIEGMKRLAEKGEVSIAGFEANGGFLLGTSLPGLDALPTRDALLPMIAVLASTTHTRRPLAALVAELPSRFTYSDRLKNVPSDVSKTLLFHLTEDANRRDILFAGNGRITEIDTTDGVRLTFANEDIAHLRASGNAPELRCYTEAASHKRAKAFCSETLERIIAQEGLRSETLSTVSQASRHSAGHASDEG